MRKEASLTAPAIHPVHQTNAYDDWLRRKVERARVSMRAGQGKSQDEVEAEFAARRKQAVSQV